MKGLRNLIVVMLFAFVLLFGLTPSNTYAQDSQDICEKYELSLEGPSDFEVGHMISYSAVLLDKVENTKLVLDETLEWAEITYRVFQWTNVLHKTTEGPVVFTFPEVGVYDISANVTTEDCTFQSTLVARSYDDVFFYLWEFVEDFNEGLEQNLQQHEVLFSKFILDVGEDLDSNEQRKQNLENKYTDIDHSQIVFFNLTNFSNIFSIIEQWQETEWISFAEKKVVVVSSIDPALLKKFLAPFFKGQNFELYLINMDELRNVFFYLSIGEISKVYDSFQNPVTFVGWSQSFTLGSLVDVMIYSWFSMDVLAMLMVVALSILLLVFLRQVIGFSVYGLYYPLLMAGIFVWLWETLTILFFIIALIAHLVSLLIQEKINMLVHAKMWLYLVIYILLTMLFLGLMTAWFDYQWNIGISQDIFIVISYLLIPIVAKKSFSGLKSFFKTKTAVNIVWYLVLSYILALLLMSVWLQHRLLVRPGLIFIILVLVIMLGKFTGLQVMEYIRFWPLIKDQLSSKKPKKIKAPKKSVD